MEILVLGGTRFVGRHMVELALARGDTLTLFHRGRHARGLFPDVEEIHGDRDGDLDRLGDRAFDAVIDTSGYVERIVRASCETFRDRCGRYLFVSSISAYADFSRPLEEDAPLAVLGDPSWAEEEDRRSYGARKARCEAAVRDVLGARGTLLRPGIVAGPHDLTDRVTYWVRRLARGGEVAAPGRPARPVQFVDARDLATFALRCLDEDLPGPFNVTGPEGGVPMGELLEACRAAAGTEATLRWVPDELCEDPEVGDLASALPFRFPDAAPGYGTTPIRRALDAGFTPRPVADTVADLLDWDRARGTPALACGPSPEEEARLLAAVS